MAEQSWGEVGARIATLGRTLKEHLDKQPVDADAPGDTLKTAVDTLRRAMEAMGDAVRDPGVQDQTKQAAKSLVDAITNSVEELAGQLRNKRTDGGGTGRNDG